MKRDPEYTNSCLYSPIIERLDNKFNCEEGNINNTYN